MLKPRPEDARHDDEAPNLVGNQEREAEAGEGSKGHQLISFVSPLDQLVSTAL